MKLSIDRVALLNGIGIVSKAVSNRTTKEILKCVLLTADGEGLRLMGNNLELGIQTSAIEADVETDGSVALEAKLFSEIIKKLPDGDVEIEVNKQRLTVIKCGKSVFTIPGDDPDEFPAMPDVERGTRFAVKRGVLRDMIQRTIFAASYDETKPVLTGELMAIENGILNIAAVDGFRIAYRFSEAGEAGVSVKAVVPGMSMSEIAKLLGGPEDAEAVLYFTDKHIMLELDSCRIVSRLINGEFINYKSVLASNHSTLTTLNRDELLSCLDRAILIASDSKKKNHVEFDIRDGVISVASHTERGDLHDEISAEVEGGDLKIAFNPKYLIDALRAIESERVAVHYGGALEPCVIRPAGEGNYQYLVLPVRLGA